jgi:Glycosyl hydrolase family 12
MTCRLRALPAFLMCLTSATAVTVAGLGPATATTATVSCKRWQALHATGTDGNRYVIRNKPSINKNDQGMCISESGQDPAFTVTRSPGAAPSSTVRAFPYIGTGCFQGACAQRKLAVLPRAAALGNYTVGWTTVTPPDSGVWNASLDLWLGPRSGVGASEVMIWLQYSKPSWWVGHYPIVQIDGAKWYVVPRAATSGPNYISFRRATPATGAKLRIAPFMAAAKRLGGVNLSSLLWSAQAGFEIWSGGQGLQVTSFSVSG